MMESSTLTAVEVEQPSLMPDETFLNLVKKLSVYITGAITQPCTFEQLRTTSYGTPIRTLVDHLVRDCTNPAIVNAILTLKFHFSSLEPDDRGLNDTRANACEIVAWRFLGRLSERDAIQYCLYELPSADDQSEDSSAASSLRSAQRPRRLSAVGEARSERSSLLPQFRPNNEREHRELTLRKRAANDRRRQMIRSVTDRHIFEPSTSTSASDDSGDEEDPTSAFAGLNALEIAAVANAKRFLSQRLVQKVITGLWNGEVTLWDSLAVTTVKKPRFYNRHTADPFSRLRVPKFQQCFDTLFHLTFLAIYYFVLIRREPSKITGMEVLLYIWLFAFSYDELCEFTDAGLFYYADFWSTFDLCIIVIGAAFLVTRVVGLLTDNNNTTEVAFDILSLEALFLVPRSVSLLSLNPYVGVLLPSLKEMAKDFVKFMSIVLILYLGFFTTFILLARDTFSFSEMSWILMKVFFGASFVGFDVMHLISPVLGPPLMIIFVILSNILLTTSLISLLSNSFMRVTSHAREEYLFIYSVYVLEASTSNRLTHFYPPLNLIPLILLRPLRLILGQEKMRRVRISMLKFTHAPFVAGIWCWESFEEWWWGRQQGTFAVGIGPVSEDTPRAKQSSKRPLLESRTRVESHHYTGPGPDTPVVKSRNRAGDAARDGSSSADTSGMDGGPAEHNRDLEAKVDELSVKIAELTALVMAQNMSAQG